MYTFPTPAEPPKRLSLALQGGGAHGAFTWGALDALLEDGRFDFDGISGASAGAINAIALAQGYLGHPPGDGERQAIRASARQTLRRVWEGVVALGSVGALTQSVMHMMLNTSMGGHMLQSAMAPWMSPSQMNPMDINPLRKLLATHIDFEGLARLHSPRVFVSATHVRTGLAKVFSGRQLDLQAVMASTCLPMVFRTVEIDGEPFWDGGYSSNPPLVPLIKQCDAQDILVVQINPLQRHETPHSQQDILDRVNELTFNASLLDQMRNVEFINQLIERGRMQEGEDYRRIRLHRIDGGQALENLPASSKVAADGNMIERLFQMGQDAAKHWLKRHFDDVGLRATLRLPKP